MAKFAELKNVKLDDMTLLHQNDIHCDLVIDKNSDLAVLGSLSHRFNVGPIMNEIEVETNTTNMDTSKEIIENEEKGELNKVKKELKKCEKCSIENDTV